MPNKSTMTRDALLFLPAKIVEGLLIIACSSLYTHIFSESTVATFNIINPTVQLLYLILAGWMANATTRYIGEEFHQDKGQRLFSTISTIYILICLIIAVTCGITFSVTRDAAWIGGAVMFFSYTCFQILNSALIQLGRVRQSIVFSLLSAVLKVVVAYALVGGASSYPSAFPAIAANTLADGIAGIGAACALSLPTLARLRFFSKPLLKQFLKYGVPLMGVSISVALLNQIDRFFVKGFLGDTPYAYYSSNYSIASGIFTMISVGIMRGVYPAVLRGWRENGQTAAKPLLDAGVRLYLLIALPAVTGLAAIALPLSRFLFASGYDAGAPVIGFTALAMLFMGLTEYANKAYELKQSTLAVLQNSAAAAVVKVLSSIVLIKAFGFVGGALGSVTAFLFYFMITVVRVRQHFLFHIPPLRLARMLLCAILCGIAAFTAAQLPVAVLLQLALGVLAGGVTYAITIILSGEARQEAKAIAQKIQHMLMIKK